MLAGAILAACASFGAIRRWFVSPHPSSRPALSSQCCRDLASTAACSRTPSRNMAQRSNPSLYEEVTLASGGGVVRPFALARAAGGRGEADTGVCRCFVSDR